MIEKYITTYNFTNGSAIFIRFVDRKQWKHGVVENMFEIFHKEKCGIVVTPSKEYFKVMILDF